MLAVGVIMSPIQTVFIKISLKLAKLKLRTDTPKDVQRVKINFAAVCCFIQ